MKLAYLLVLGCVAGLAVGQLIFKYVGNRIASLSWSELTAHPDVAAVFAAGVALYGVTTIFWVMALRELPLSRAYVFAALAFVLVPVGAWLVFGEKLTANYMIGVALIVTGIIVSAS